MLTLVPYLIGCGSPEAAVSCERLTQTEPVDAGQSNVLVILTDDIGIDKTAAYCAHPDPTSTPNINQLACAGVTFTSAYANPVCSPSRSALMTGRHGSRTGIGRWIYADNDTFDLQLDEVTLPELLSKSPHGYSSAAVGKWHLVDFERGTDPAIHPNEQGFSHYAGSLGNPLEAIQEGNTPRGYENWEKVTNGFVEWVTTYMVTDTADEAVAQIDTLSEPWLLYVAFNGAHDPVHTPPQSLITTPTTGLSTDRKKYDAMVEATDTEIGRVLSSIPPDVLARTTIIYLSDNGTPGGAITAPWDDTRGKGTLYEGGVNVPMIVTGPLVAQPGRTSDALVHFVDFFPTFAELAEVPLDDPRAGFALELDGVSFLPTLLDPDAGSAREIVYSEKFYPNGAPPYDYHHRMVTDGQWKLIRKDEDGEVTEELYRLEGWQDGDDRMGELETDPEAAEAHDRLGASMAEHIETLAFEY